MPTLYLLIAAIIGPILVGVSTYGVEELWRQPRAIAKAVQAEAERCAGRVAEIAQKTSDDALAKVDERDAALQSMVPTPDERDGVKALCPKEKACRK